MSMSTLSRLIVVAACVTAAALTPGTAALAAPAHPSCSTSPVALTVEEQRLETGIGGGEAVPAQILRRSGFANRVSAFTQALCASRGYAAASLVVADHARRLWQAAVARAQGDAAGLPADDDRPLYWARLGLTRALRQWVPPFDVSAARRAALEQQLEYASRGITTSAVPSPFTGTARTLFVTGFDPFQLDSEIRRGNPSGAAALSLDGRILVIDGVRVRVQTVVLPVRYADFDRGIAEDAIRPHVTVGRQRADVITTVSQGRPGRFDLEVWNGRRRDVVSIGDNNNIWGGGSPTAPLVFPGVGPGPEFLHTSLPLDAMSAVAGQPFPINVNTSVAEIPLGGAGPVLRPDGPTEGSIAVEGGGGGYLSNEVAYRNTLLLAGATRAPAGGHLHTPVLNLSATNLTEITDPVFEQQRAAIVAEVQALVGRAAVSAP
jgi:pyrrolidone-carboxylate peptidase